LKKATEGTSRKRVKREPQIPQLRIGQGRLPVERAAEKVDRTQSLKSKHTDSVRPDAKQPVHELRRKEEGPQKKQPRNTKSLVPGGERTELER